jgi:Rhodopirellula transposase DDE domain
VISVDPKKKELVGPYKNAGSDYRPKGCPDKVNVHDFVDKELGQRDPERRL